MALARKLAGVDVLTGKIEQKLNKVQRVRCALEVLLCFLCVVCMSEVRSLTAVCVDRSAMKRCFLR